MLRKFLLKDTETQSEFRFPVTPKEFCLTSGVQVETVKIHQVGEVCFPGYGTLANVSLDCLFPAQRYAFASGGDGDSPYGCVARFQAWAKAGTVLRFIISDTTVNLPVICQEISYGERDGTNDVYAQIRLREYRELKAARVDRQGGNDSRPADAGVKGSPQSYTVVKNDNLWNICRDQYGDATLYKKLADYNGIQNPSLIYPGQVLRLPDRGMLG